MSICWVVHLICWVLFLWMLTFLFWINIWNSHIQNGAEKRKLSETENGDNGAPEPKKREKLEAGELFFTGATDWKVLVRDFSRKPVMPKFYTSCFVHYLGDRLLRRGMGGYPSTFKKEEILFRWGLLFFLELIFSQDQ